MNVRLQRSSWLLTSLLGMTLLLGAGLVIALLSGIGWMTWQQARLSEHWTQIRGAAAQQDLVVPNEAQRLQEFIASTQEGIANMLNAFPTDDEVAQHISRLQAEASAQGVFIMEVSPHESSSIASTRCFVLKARGTWLKLVDLAIHISQTLPAMARLENVTLYQLGEQAELTLELVFTVRPDGL